MTIRAISDLWNPCLQAAVGTMTSVFPLAYGGSKFLAGVLGAKYSARLLLAGGLAATAATNLAFGASTSLTLWCALWGLNGLLQVRYSTAVASRSCARGSTVVGLLCHVIKSSLSVSTIVAAAPLDHFLPGWRADGDPS